MPLVTVVLPIYNGMPYLPEAVASILDQSLRDLRLLIIDDGSTDGTADYLDSLFDARIEVVRGTNRGLGVVLNHALSLCRTEFLARMDADDLSSPRRLEKQLTFLRSRPEVGMVGSRFDYIGRNRKRVLSPLVPCDHTTIMAELLRGNLAMVHASAVFRTAVLRQIGGYRIRGTGQDWDLFLRLGETARLANHPEVLYSYRLHRQNSGLQRFVAASIGIRYACHCAELRRHGEPEPTPDAFREKLESSAPFRMTAVLDAYALSQYRRALVDLADERKIRGYARLGWSAICSPRRTLVRIQRMFFGFRRH